MLKEIKKCESLFSLVTWLGTVDDCYAELNQAVPRLHAILPACFCVRALFLARSVKKTKVTDRNGRFFVHKYE